MRQDRLALDRGTVRSKDEDGRLHLAVTNISKANVCGYLGSEIPDADKLGLKPDQIYQLLRCPEELEKSASTFNNLPVLTEHVPVTAEDHRPDIVVGSTGTDATFDAPYLRASMVIWAAPAIELIESGRQKEISSAYRYEADMTPGTYEGVNYDGVMRNIRGSHVALVENGRAGPDVRAADSALPNTKETYMPQRISRKAAMARGALAVALKPKLAQDHKLDLNKVLNKALSSVTAENWKSSKPKIVSALKSSTKGHLAQDADLEDVCELLDALDDKGALKDDEMGVDDVPEEADTADDDDDKIEKIMSMLKEMLKPEQLEKIKTAVAPKAAQDEPPPFEGKPGVGAQKANDMEEEDKVSKAAMDAAISSAVRKAEENTVKRMAAIAEAKEIVEPLIGKIAVAMDSADAVYAMAIKTVGGNPAGVNSAGLKSMAEFAVAKNVEQSRPKATVAMDSATLSDLDRYRKEMGLTATPVRRI